jgi:hypothetical protein
MSYGSVWLAPSVRPRTDGRSRIRRKLLYAIGALPEARRKPTSSGFLRQRVVLDLVGVGRRTTRCREFFDVGLCEVDHADRPHLAPLVDNGPAELGSVSLRIRAAGVDAKPSTSLVGYETWVTFRMPVRLSTNRDEWSISCNTSLSRVTCLE